MSCIYKIIITLTLGLLFFSNVNAQSTSNNKFIQCIFSNMEKPGQAKKIEDFIRQQEGVFMVRANFNSRKFFLIYRADADINLSKVEEWMKEYNLTFKCVREGVHGIDPVIDQKLDCE
jgi:hypothetical protein